MVGVNWHDAQAYAGWMSRTTGLNYRLPTDQEWSFAAAESARSEVAPLVDPSDPAQAWIARYEAESARAASVVLAPQRVGTFGQNSNGLRDVGGNVWEWTDTCFVRATLDDGSLRVTNTNCGVRVVQGAHRTYMTDFIRDPRTGGCAAGVPPANLGFRLVIETGFPGMRGMVSNFFGSLRRSLQHRRPSADNARPGGQRHLREASDARRAGMGRSLDCPLRPGPRTCGGRSRSRAPSCLRLSSHRQRLGQGGDPRADQRQPDALACMA